ncbi:hypothetical protein [Desulfobacter sp. UBA2225]|uniref:hypothetical protein n=2 Tax=unclassified Desulfobacter TaxID=2634406 RepID=UPI00257AB8CA|nr:hypothetical protein [Desulfobacter sp. UBA2225]
MSTRLPEKALLLKRLKDAGFSVPDFLYVPAENFKTNEFAELEAFLKNYRDGFKVIARSAHPDEEYFKGGSFDSIPTYSDISGIKYARKRMVKSSLTAKALSIKRQQKFNRAPEIDPEQMGLIAMPFIDGSSVMAKMIGRQWEFGYCRDRQKKLSNEPFITRTPHDRKLIDLSTRIQDFLGFSCEIEYIITYDNDIYIVQAKDISKFDLKEMIESEQHIIVLDGIRRIRKRHSYRERPTFVMDNQSFYLEVITQCEKMVHGWGDQPTVFEDILGVISDYQQTLESFALQHWRFAVLGLSIIVPGDLRQVVNHYLEDTPELQKQLSKALYDHHYFIDRFMAEADTVIARDKVRLNLDSHDAYGVDTVRNPLWSVYWYQKRHAEVCARIRSIGFKTGDTIGIEINPDGKPQIFKH